MGRGGVISGLGPKKAKIGSEVDFSRWPKSVILARGVKNDLRFFREIPFRVTKLQLTVTLNV